MVNSATSGAAMTSWLPRVSAMRSATRTSQAQEVYASAPVGKLESRDGSPLLTNSFVLRRLYTMGTHFGRLWLVLNTILAVRHVARYSSQFFFCQDHVTCKFPRSLVKVYVKQTLATTCLRYISAMVTNGPSSRKKE